MSGKLTNAGRKMIAQWIEHAKSMSGCEPRTRAIYTASDGRIFMTLAPGDGAAAMTLRKLVRDGFATGTFNWGSQSRWMIPTQAGLDEYNKGGAA